jgi:cytoskeletal protein CcmA (bactofilin family)
MADAGNPGAGDFPTVLGPDANFKGELSFDKGMRLMGKFEGKVNTPGRVHVAKEAKMSADVEAGGIVVEGEVHGNLSANDRIELKQSARYEGDLRATKLVVDEGAVFSGHVTVGPDSVKTRPGTERERERDRERVGGPGGGPGGPGGPRPGQGAGAAQPQAAGR